MSAYNEAMELFRSMGRNVQKYDLTSQEVQAVSAKHVSGTADSASSLMRHLVDTWLEEAAAEKRARERANQPEQSVANLTLDREQFDDLQELMTANDDSADTRFGILGSAAKPLAEVLAAMMWAREGKTV